MLFVENDEGCCCCSDEEEDVAVAVFVGDAFEEDDDAWCHSWHLAGEKKTTKREVN